MMQNLKTYKTKITLYSDEIHFTLKQLMLYVTSTALYYVNIYYNCFDSFEVRGSTSMCFSLLLSYVIVTP